MKVLLCEDVENLGWLGDVVEVKDGYARNYLLPEGLVQIPTENNIAALADEKAKRAEMRLKDRQRLEAAAEKVNGAEAVIAAKTNELGHLFGSVTAAMIAENLRSQGLAVADEVVKLGDHIKEVGTSKVALRFASDLRVEVNVTVVSDDPEIQQKIAEARAQEKSEAQAEEQVSESETESQKN
ncbi:MAG: 50S ribosomal protein L9 [Phycisphaerae bacterium]|nr:50S ribosomal protein L9 [Phycisphaerae bacterium]